MNPASQCHLFGAGQGKIVTMVISVHPMREPFQKRAGSSADLGSHSPYGLRYPPARDPLCHE